MNDEEIIAQNTGTMTMISIFVLALLVCIIIVLFLVFIKRKNKLLIERQENERKFENAIAETQIEIREQTLRNISWELHDNIGQLLTLAKIQLHQLGDSEAEGISEVSETISKSLTELRALSKLINPDALRNITLTQAISMEVARFRRMNFIEVDLNIKGEVLPIEHKTEIILFRMLQEFFSNTIKHARASKLSINIFFSQDNVKIIAEDNGQGFDMSNMDDKKGIGLINIQSRGKLIGAKIDLQSSVNQGTKLTIIHYL